MHLDAPSPQDHCHDASPATRPCPPVAIQLSGSQEPLRSGWSPPPSCGRRRWRGVQIYQQFMSVNKFVSGWHRTGAYFTAKLTFSHNFPIKVWVHIIQVCILYSNFYGTYSAMQQFNQKTASSRGHQQFIHFSCSQTVWLNF